MRKTKFTFTTEERKKIKKLYQRKRISTEALRQIQGLILHEAGVLSIMAIADEIARGSHKLMKWVKAFKAERMDSLLVYTEDYSKVKNKGKTKVVLVNAPSKDEQKDPPKKETSKSQLDEKKDELTKE